MGYSSHWQMNCVEYPRNILAKSYDKLPDKAVTGRAGETKEKPKRAIGAYQLHSMHFRCQNYCKLHAKSVTVGRSNSFCSSLHLVCSDLWIKFYDLLFNLPVLSFKHSTSNTSTSLVQLNLSQTIHGVACRSDRLSYSV